MHLLFIGDSLIEFFDWQERFPDHSVMNLGMAGESVHGLLSRILALKNVCPRSDFIFIMSGINNIAMGDDEFIDSYRVIIEKLSGLYPDAGIYVHSLLPVSVEFISNVSVRNTNASLKSLADSMQVFYLDIFSKFVDKRGRLINRYLTGDGVHVSREGYAVWSGFIEQVIESNTPYIT